MIKEGLSSHCHSDHSSVTPPPLLSSFPAHRGHVRFRVSYFSLPGVFIDAANAGTWGRYLEDVDAADAAERADLQQAGLELRVCRCSSLITPPPS